MILNLHEYFDCICTSLDSMHVINSFLFFRSLLEAGGVDRLMTITRQRQRFTPRVVKFASQVLYSMWVHQDLRETYRKAGWKEADFVTKTVRRIYHTLYLQILLSDKIE